MISTVRKLHTALQFFAKSVLDIVAMSSVRTTRTNTVLIVQTEAIGDFVLWQSFAKQLVDFYRPRRVVLATNAIVSDLASATGYFDEVIGIDVRAMKYGWHKRAQLLRRIRRLGPSIAIQPTYSRSFWVGDSLIRASNARTRIGSQGDHHNIRPWQKRVSDHWYTELLPATRKPLHESQRHAEFLERLTGVAASSRIKPFPQTTETRNPDIPPEPYMVFVPGAGTDKRMWPVQRFAETARRLHQETGLRLVICGSKSETELAETLGTSSRVPSPIILAGRTSVPDLVDIIHRASLVIANDSSAIHIAAATETPSVCVLGGGHFGRFLPYPSGSTNVEPETVYARMECFGCNWQCTQPYNGVGPFPCIDAISVDGVMDKAMRRLDETRTEVCNQAQ